MNLSASHKSWMCTYVFRVVERVTECVALVAVCCNVLQSVWRAVCYSELQL